MKNLIIIATLCICFTAKSQDYYHGLGAGYYIGMTTYEYENQAVSGENSESLGAPGIMYKATLGWDISRSSTFAVSAYPFLGFLVSSQQGSYIATELPLLAEYYFGTPDDFCFYVNGGAAFGFVNGGGDGLGIVGPQAGLGGQFEFRGNLIGLRGSYTLGLNKDDSYITDKRSAITLGVYYVFN